MQSPLLSINNLSVTFNSEEGSTPTLQNIDIEIAKGELVAIVGESGSGKSVTSLSVLQLLPQPPAKYLNGSILLYSDNNTINILETPKHILQNIRGNKIAMIFQEPMTSLNPVLTCGNQVMEAICLHKKLSKKIAKAQTIDLFKKVKLPNADLLFNRYPHEISGGQKQRVMIAMAMSCEPDLLICDEPTTALDVTVQKNVLELIKELQIHNNMGVIFITHDLSVVAEIADKIVVMYKGKIVETGTVQTIFKTPKHPYTKALLACRPALYPKNTRLPIVSDFMNDDGTEKELIQKFPTISSQEIEMNTAQLPKQEAILSVEHLKVYYPSKKTFLGKITAYNKAVDHVSFSVYKAETFGLVGESECGK